MQPDTVDPIALAQRAYAYLVELTRDHSPRASATEQEAEAAEYLADSYRRMGYQATVQTFDVEVMATDPPVLQVDHPQAPEIDAQPLRLSAETSAKTAPTGELAHAGMVLGDLPAGSLDGKVALIERGVIPFETKVSRVSLAGAVAAVIYNNQPGQFSGTLSTPPRIPAVSISQEVGQELLALIAAGPVNASVSVRFEARQSRNVIAEKPGTDPTAGTIILGGHFDTVPDVPGANDNGSGVATVLAVAEAIAAPTNDRSYPFAVRFIDFGSEELGLEGSRHYLASLPANERSSIIAMMNFDALGTGRSAGVFGSEQLVDRALAAARAQDVSLSDEPDIQGGSSDFASFEAAGIPFLFFLADDFSRIHTPDDALDHVDGELLGAAAAIAIGVLDGMAAQ